MTYLQSTVDPHVELLQLVLRDGSVVGAEELLDLDPCQAAVPAPLSEPGRGLWERQRSTLQQKCQPYYDTVTRRKDDTRHRCDQTVIQLYNRKVKIFLNSFFFNFLMNKVQCL